MNLSEMQAFAKRNNTAMLELLKELCAIPAPSGLEQARAQFCKTWLEKHGARGVYIDSALNVIYPLNCEGSDAITVFAAHTDTVFPDTEAMPYLDDGEKIHCPGVGDDTASVCVLLMLAKFYIENGLQPEKGILFVCNACEEGLGNLKGTRQLFSDYENRVAQFVSFDSQLGMLNDDCAGSHRYAVTVKTRGGHSFQDFGAANAINELAKMIAAIYKIELPVKEGVRTTFNVGSVTGGTSVNTIAQSADMLCEYRSEDKDCLFYMQQEFSKIFQAAKRKGVEICVEQVGDRPCSDISRERMDALVSQIRPLVEDVTQKPMQVTSASTDCNIPLSLGIPAVCVGVYTGGGSHTRQEWVQKDSLQPGLELAIRIAMRLTRVQK